VWLLDERYGDTESMLKMSKWLRPELRTRGKDLKGLPPDIEKAYMDAQAAAGTSSVAAPAGSAAPYRSLPRQFLPGLPMREALQGISEFFCHLAWYDPSQRPLSGEALQEARASCPCQGCGEERVKAGVAATAASAAVGVEASPPSAPAAPAAVVVTAVAGAVAAAVGGAAEADDDEVEVVGGGRGVKNKDWEVQVVKEKSASSASAKAASASDKDRDAMVEEGTSKGLPPPPPPPAASAAAPPQTAVAAPLPAAVQLPLPSLAFAMFGDKAAEKLGGRKPPR